MNRVVKFRVWDIKRKRLTYPKELSISESLIEWGNGGSPRRCNANGCTLEQFTGLLDKNGKEIYEGDIVEPNYFYSGQPEKRYPNMVVEFEHGRFYLNEWWFSNKLGLIRVDGSSHMLSEPHPITTGRVIGNIHENPDLLKS